VLAGVLLLPCVLLLIATPLAHAQAPSGASNSSAARTLTASSTPIAIVPIDSGSPDQGATVTGALEVTGGRAMIATSGTITAGTRTTDVLLPHRGTLRVCASTAVKLAADSSVPAGETPGLLMAIDRGALEMSFATLQNADTLLTPDFRIVIAGPGSAEVKVRLGDGGDTCVDNAGTDSPYVIVSSLYSNGLYRVQPGQRVMFQGGNLSAVIDQEKEPCGCPPAASESAANEFPLAQSEGLAPTPTPAGASGGVPAGASAGVPTGAPGGVPAGASANGAKLTPPADALVYKSADHAPQTVELPKPATSPASTAPGTSSGSNAHPPQPVPNPGFFHKIGRFFRRIFGAES
jgi:hypothetical protein